MGAAKELRTFFQKNEADIKMFSQSKGTTWHFISPCSQTFGGIWEAGVRSVKHHLKRVIGNAMLHYEELINVLTQIEG